YCPWEMPSIRCREDLSAVWLCRTGELLPRARSPISSWLKHERLAIPPNSHPLRRCGWGSISCGSMEPWYSRTAPSSSTTHQEGPPASITFPNPRELEESLATYETRG